MSNSQCLQCPQFHLLHIHHGHSATNYPSSNIANVGTYLVNKWHSAIGLAMLKIRPCFSFVISSNKCGLAQRGTAPQRTNLVWWWTFNTLVTFDLGKIDTLPHFHMPPLHVTHFHCLYLLHFLHHFLTWVPAQCGSCMH